MVEGGGWTRAVSTAILLPTVFIAVALTMALINAMVKLPREAGLYVLGTVPGYAVLGLLVLCVWENRAGISKDFFRADMREIADADMEEIIKGIDERIGKTRRVRNSLYNRVTITRIGRGAHLELGGDEDGSVFHYKVPSDPCESVSILLFRDARRYSREVDEVATAVLGEQAHED